MTRFVIILSTVLWLLPACTVKSQELLDAVNETFSDVSTINVKGAFCKVDFETGGGSSVQLVGEIRSIRPSDDYDIKFEQKEGELNVWIEFPKSVDGVKGFLHITAPAGVRVKAETISGTVSIAGMGNEELLISSVSGDINADNIPCKTILKTVSGTISAKSVAGTLSVKTVSGSINAADINGTVELASTSGSISVAGIYANVSCKSVSGTIEMKDINGQVEARNTSGCIRLTNIAGSINAATVSGSVNGSQVMIIDNSSVKTTSGSISIALLNVPRSLSYDLQSTNGNLEAGNVKSSRRLSISEGPVTITGRSVSGSIKFQQ